MATKSANLYARIEPDIKEQAEDILSTLGIPASNAINMFYKQIILQKGLPFDVKIPSVKPVNMNLLSDEMINSEIEKGYADIQAGRTKSANQVFSNIPFIFYAPNNFIFFTKFSKCNSSPSPIEILGSFEWPSFY